MTSSTHAQTGSLPSVLVLGGGPDAERPVSLESAAAVDDALRRAGLMVHTRTIDTPTLAQLGEMPGEVVFPVLHGRFGEGGPLQDLLEALGRPFVGAGGKAARLAMDKLATKLCAASAGLKTLPSYVFCAADSVCPFSLPVVIKPVHEGSSVGLYICEDQQSWIRAHAAVVEDIAASPGRVYMVEPMVSGRELTVGVIEDASGALEALPIVEIIPAEKVYDYAAKYDRNDTRYQANPDLPAGVEACCSQSAISLVGSMGIGHVCRVDFLLECPQNSEPNVWLLEANTMPGFTAHSLLPMAAQAAGLDMPALCAQLVGRACAGAMMPSSTGDDGAELAESKFAESDHGGTHGSNT